MPCQRNATPALPQAVGTPSISIEAPSAEEQAVTTLFGDFAKGLNEGDLGVRLSETAPDAYQPIVASLNAAQALLGQNPNVQSIAANDGHLEIALKTGVTDYSFIPRQLIAAGFKLMLLKEEEVNLETAFMRLTKGMVQ